MKIWRKVRQKLIDEGQLKKYLFYAVGEIILVMAGILLAVYINNSQEHQKTIEKQKEYLALIRNEMITNQENLKEEHDQLKNSIRGQRSLLFQIDSLEDNYDEATFSKNWTNAFSGEIKCALESSALSELKYSGVLKDIQNDSIRLLLASWEGRLLKLKYQEEGVKESRTKCNNYMEEYGNFRSIFNLKAHKNIKINQSEKVNSNKHILQSEQVENMLLISLAQATQLDRKIYPQINDLIQKVISLIDKEIEI